MMPSQLPPLPDRDPAKMTEPFRPAGMKAPANALMLKKTLSGHRVQAPAGLIAAYPELAEAADPMRPIARDASKQGRLF